MKAAYFDCFSGASGDMILGALIDAGADFEQIESTLSSLELSGYELSSTQVLRGSLRACRLEVQVASEHHSHRHLSDILQLLDSSGLDRDVVSAAGRIFERLAQAEAAVHGIDVEQVHFHEVGAVDSIVDIVGACVALNLLSIEKVYCSQLATGSGTVRCAHGDLPVPAPATAQLLVGVPTTVGYPNRELTTPTGAAILTTWTDSFGPAPDMRVENIGYGAGQADYPEHPNVLRLMLGQVLAQDTQQVQTDRVWMVQTNLDDATGEIIGPLYDSLFAGGALDVYVTPIQMKKNRPGMLLSVLVPEDKLAEAENTIFEHTPTFGLRRHLCHRSKLARRTVEVQTCYGNVRIKVGSRGSQELTASPEFEDCRAAAGRHGVSPRQVYNEALACYRRAADKPSNKQEPSDK